MQKTIDRRAIETGWEVYSEDGTHLGSVDEVGANYVLLQKGFFFPREVYIPLTAIDRAEDDSVWLNVHKNHIDAQAWDDPPAADRDTSRIPMDPGATR